MSESPLKLQSERIKRQKIIDESKCLICNKSGKLTSPYLIILCFFQRPESKDDNLGIKCFINKETNSFQDDIYSSIRWHKVCYASFTSKKNMTSALKHMDDNVFKGQCSADSSEPSTRSKVCTNIDFKSVCFFCEKITRKNDRKLVRVQWPNFLESLEEKCSEKEDHNLRMKIDGDFSKLPALEARYHKDCHALYMKNKLSSSGGKNPYDEAFDRLVDYLVPLLYNGRATEMSNLLDKYKEFLSEIESEDDIDPTSYRTEHLKARMQKHFGQTIAFADQKRKTSSQIVYSSSIDMKDVINIASDYKEASNDLKVIGEVEDIQNDAGLDSYDRVLFYAGSVVKAEIKNVTGINTAPPSPDDISLAKDKEIIPKCLISLLSWICGTSDYKEQKVLAIAQDIIMVASSDKKCYQSMLAWLYL